MDAEADRIFALADTLAKIDKLQNENITVSAHSATGYSGDVLLAGIYGPTFVTAMYIDTRRPAPPTPTPPPNSTNGTNSTRSGIVTALGSSIVTIVDTVIGTVSSILLGKGATSRQIMLPGAYRGYVNAIIENSLIEDLVLKSFLKVGTGLVATLFRKTNVIPPQPFWWPVWWLSFTRRCTPNWTFQTNPESFSGRAITLTESLPLGLEQCGGGTQGC